MKSSAIDRRMRRARSEFRDEVCRAARGRWPMILQECGIDAKHLRNGHGPCPGCGGENRFRFDNLEGRGTFFCNQRTPQAGDGFDLLQHVRGWSFRNALHRVAEVVGLHPSGLRCSRPAPLAITDSRTANLEPTEEQSSQASIPLCLESIIRIEHGSAPVSPDGEVMKYLRGRGLDGIEDDLPLDLLEHVGLGYHEEGKRIGTFPAMVGRVRDISGALTGVHLTYLLNGQKARIPNAKKMRAVGKGALKGAAIRLYEATDRVAITEGIENALAVRLATGWPTWAATSATLLGQVRLPPSVREVVIWADHDQAGLRAAAALESRLKGQGRSVRVCVAPERGMDPLDWLLTSQGEAA
jgi:putative DNA primase/helicase